MSLCITYANASYVMPFFDLNHSIDFLLKLPDVQSFFKQGQSKEQIACALLISSALKKNAPVQMQQVNDALVGIMGNQLAYYAIKGLYLETAFNNFVSHEKMYWKKQEKLLHQTITIKMMLEDTRLKDELFLKFFEDRGKDQEAFKIMHEKMDQVSLEIMEMVFEKLDKMSKWVI
jgi:hypothetical protein